MSGLCLCHPDRLKQRIYIKRLGVRWQDVDLDTGTLAVRQVVLRIPDPTQRKKTILTLAAPPKTARSHRTIPLPRECTSALRAHRARQAEEKLKAGPLYQDHGLVFAKPDGGPLEPGAINAAFARMLKRAGLPHIRLHDARHTYATWLHDTGVSLKGMADLLGHSSIRVTGDIYTHFRDERKRAAADGLSAAIWG